MPLVPSALFAPTIIDADAGTLSSSTGTGIAKTMLLDLYRRHAGELRGYLSSQLRCEETAADLTQEIFVRLSGHDQAAMRNPLALAYHVARNLVIDHYRRQRARPECDEPREFDDMPSTAPDPEETAAIRQRLHRVEDAMRRLSPQCRQAFVLNRFDGLSQAEVAEEMGISRQMAERHIAKALLYLRTRLDDIKVR